MGGKGKGKEGREGMKGEVGKGEKI